MTATASNRGETRQLLTGWGRTAPSLATVVRPQSSAEVATVLATRGPRGVIARGMVRSYGDPAQNAGGTVVQTSGLDQMWLDTVTGVLTAQAGCSLDATLRRRMASRLQPAWAVNIPVAVSSHIWSRPDVCTTVPPAFCAGSP